MNKSMLDGRGVYAREPKAIHDGIPIFSSKDNYVENYEKIAADHVAQINESQENPFMEEELWVSLEASTREYIQRHVAKGSRILDVGVGLGRLLEPLVEYERYGVDISLDYLQIAKRRGIEVALAKIEELPYSPGFFDAIVVCDVLEHVLDLNYCCEKILSCLRPGGVLIARVPFKEDLGAYLDDSLPYEFIHLRNFDEAGLRLFFGKIFGLQFLEGAPTTHYLQGSPRLKLRLLPDEVRSRLAALAEGQAEFSAVASAFDVSEEKFQAWIYGLKQDSKDLFRQISPDLIYGIDINMVFVKPYHADVSLGALRASVIQSVAGDRGSKDQLVSGLGRDFLKFKADMERDGALNVARITRLEQTVENKSKDVGDAHLALKSEIASLYQAVRDLQNAWPHRLARKIRTILRIAS
jgi:2-polyprenyl-3-methyl-5-hydroxy-6-metoxy-1,4-benzoquinol methylase